MKAREIVEHFLSLADWVDRENTVDGVILGDPQKEVSSVLVTWISSLAAVREAVRRGVDALITHEPTFWKHRNEHENMDASDLARSKRRTIEEAGLVVIRNHDAWDRMPEVGIPWAWAAFLGFEGPPAAVGANGYQHRYDIEAVPLEVFARRVAERTARLGEPHVQVVGDPEQTVSKIGVGTGCCCSIPAFQEIGCDLSIVCDDGSVYWSGIRQAADGGHAVIRVNHGTSEEPGMRTLTDYLNEHLPLRATHLPHGSCFRLVPGCS